jgi:hypothetical protein
MASLRLRQICLVANDLAREAEAIGSLFGLEVCCRDPNVAKYGLENVLFPVGEDFLEIVSPTRPGTAAGRFLERHGGRHGYMVIMECDDPEARGRHCAALGVRTANLIRHDRYIGVQLHPRDTGAAMLEFNHTEGGPDDYGPAGPDWKRFVRSDVTRRMLAAEITCPEPARFAARWAGLLQRPAEGARIGLDSGELHFLPGDAEPALTGVVLETADRARAGTVVEACGVRFRLV